MKKEKYARGVFYNNKYIERKDDAVGNYIYCPECHKPLYKTEKDGYYSQCISCEKSLYLIDSDLEGVESPVAVGRPPEGITLNAGLGVEYLLNEEGNITLFPDVNSAAEHLLENGVSEEWLSFFYYIDSAMQEEIDTKKINE